jgi:isopenicillin N synthase-like dioxygenase
LERTGIDDPFFILNFFKKRFTQLFRIFSYPPHQDVYGEDSFAVGEHTDYGFITVLKQDNSGGLEVKTTDGWIDVLPLEDDFVINLGDALERMTGGLLKATPHRVKQRRNVTKGRISMPFFFDPNFDSFTPSVFDMLTDVDKAMALTNRAAVNDRWDQKDPLIFEGTYGQYLLQKVAKVFPDLAKEAKIEL